jgi:hypothetical protein
MVRGAASDPLGPWPVGYPDNRHSTGVLRIDADGFAKIGDGAIVLAWMAVRQPRLTNASDKFRLSRSAA